MGIKQTISLNKVQNKQKMNSLKYEVGIKTRLKYEDSFFVNLNVGTNVLNTYSWRNKFKMMVGDEVEVRGGDQDEVEEQDGDQADDQLEQGVEDD